MKQEKDGFILMGYDEFENWLLSTKISRKIKRIQNHHTWKPDYSNFKGDNHFTLLTGMKKYHVETNGWSDIAQNITTFPDGTIAVCRDLNKTPVGIKGANTGGICIEHLGNFDIDGDEITKEHKDVIVKLNALLCIKFDLEVNTDTIIYHHWYDRTTGKRTNGTGNTKTCPGTNFFGGNTVSDADTEFLPLVHTEYSTFLLKDSENNNYSTGIVTASKLNVRSGVGTNNPVVDSLNKGDKIIIYNEIGGWYMIDMNKNKWVHSKYIDVL